MNNTMQGLESFFYFKKSTPALKMKVLHNS